MKQYMTGICVLIVMGCLTACDGSTGAEDAETETDNATGTGTEQPETAQTETVQPDKDTDTYSQTNPDTASQSENADSGWTGGTDGTVVVAEGGELIADADGKEFVCFETLCDGRILECGDCIDNDGDGYTDWRDQECLGPCDNTEGPALISDVGGVTGSTCHVDCYFDFGNGMGTGSDDCWWSHECDPLEPEAPVCEYSQSAVNKKKFCPDVQSDLCSNVCLPFTPNGCDCFGCCTFPELEGQADNGEDAYVWIGAKGDNKQGTCTFADILDQTKCPECTPVPNCLNKCDHCEICIGKPELPQDCYTHDSDDDTDPTPPAEQCDEGLTPCNYDDVMPCSQGTYCISGCCQPVSIEVE